MILHFFRKYSINTHCFLIIFPKFNKRVNRTPCCCFTRSKKKEYGKNIMASYTSVDVTIQYMCQIESVSVSIFFVKYDVKLVPIRVDTKFMPFNDFRYHFICLNRWNSQVKNNLGELTDKNTQFTLLISIV